MTGTEAHTGVCCAHPYYGFVCTPRAVLDFSEKVPPYFGHAAYAQIDADGFRNRGVPPVKPEDEFWIGLLGGSVAFSVASSTNETTISGHLERLLNLQSRERRIRVLNLALPGGQQPQQSLILLLNLSRLDGVITLDGVNELVIPIYYNQNLIPDHFPYRPYYEILFGQQISPEQIALTWEMEHARTSLERRPAFLRALTRAFVDRKTRKISRRLRATSAPSVPFSSMFSSGPPVSAEAQLEAGAQRWRDSVRHMDALCRSAGLASLFLVQPVPERGKMLTGLEQGFVDQFPDMVAVRLRAYPRLVEYAAWLTEQGVSCMALDDLFSGRTDTVYCDHIHFEDLGCEIAASAIATLLEEQWRLP